MDWIAPFSANPSTLSLQPEGSDINADRTTLFEIEVLDILNSTLNRYHSRNKLLDTKNPECKNITTYQEYLKYWEGRYKDEDKRREKLKIPESQWNEPRFPPLPIYVPEKMEDYLWKNDTYFCVPQPIKYIEKTPEIIVGNRATVKHTTNLLSSYRGQAENRPNYVKFAHKIGTHSKENDLTSSTDGYKELNKYVSKAKLPLWVTSSEQQWNRVAPL